MSNKRQAGKGVSSPNKRTKRASWTKEQVKLLKEQIEAGESVVSVSKLFPEFSSTQLHSKISNLKKQGVLKKIPSSGIAPSLVEGLYFYISNLH